MTSDSLNNFVTHAEFTQFAARNSQQFDELNQSVQRLTESIDRVREQSRTEINWGWVISGFLLLGVVITLYLEPEKRANRDQNERILAIETSRVTPTDLQKVIETVDENSAALLRRSYWMGRVDQKMVELGKSGGELNAEEGMSKQ